MPHVTPSPRHPVTPSPRQRLTQAILGSLILAFAYGGYLLVLKWRGPAAAVDTQSAWDRLIPFCPAWLYLYLAPYAVAPFLMGSMRRETFAWFLPRGLFIVAVSLVIFAVFPTRTIRPPVDDLGDGFTAQLYRHVDAVDTPPANAAPSLHVSLTCLLAIALLRDFPRWWPLTILGVGLVWLATLLTWQHHLIDVATGALLGIIGGWPIRRLRLSSPEC